MRYLFILHTCIVIISLVHSIFLSLLLQSIAINSSINGFHLLVQYLINDNWNCYIHRITLSTHVPLKMLSDSISNLSSSAGNAILDPSDSLC